MEDKRKNTGKPPRRSLDGVVYEPSQAIKSRNAIPDEWAEHTIQHDQAKRPERPSSSAQRTGRAAPDTWEEGAARRTGSSGAPLRNERPRSEIKRRPGSTPTRGKKKPPKSQFAIFYIATLFTGVVVCIIIFAMAFSSISKSKPPITDTPATTQKPSPTDVAIREINQMTGMIQEINTSTRELRIFNMENNRVYSLVATGSTQLQDKYGQDIVFAELSVGTIVDVGFDIKANTLLKLTKSPLAWELKSVKDVQVDNSNRTLTIGNDTYVYDEITIVEYNDRPHDISTIEPIDVLTITGYENKAWHVVLNKGHGLLQFINTDKIINGIIEIGTSIYMPFENLSPVPLSEGQYRVVVKGLNIDPYVKEVVVNLNETLEVDLNEVQIKTGTLSVRVNESDYSLFVNGELVSMDEPPVLSYGDYTIRVEKVDFNPWEQAVTINSPYMEINAELTKIIKMAKIKVVTYPDGANVYIDNGIIGTSPAEMNVEYGNHTIMVRKDGFTDITLNESITKPEHIFDVILQENANTVPIPDTTTLPPQDSVNTGE